MTRSVAAAVVLALLSACGGGGGGDDDELQLSFATDDTTETFSSGGDGKALFRTYCATCHGVEAKGNGPLSASLATGP